MTTMTSQAASRPTPLLSDRGFLAWFAADSCLHLAQAVVAVTLPLLASGIAGTTSLAGVLVACFSVGSLAGLLPGGLLADRWERRRLVPLLCGTVAVTTAGLAWCARSGAPALAATGVVIGLLGLVCAGLAPSLTSTLKRLVQPSRFAQAAGGSEARGAVLALAAPAVAGGLYGIRAELPFLVVAACAVVGALAFLLVPAHATHPAAPTPVPDDGARRRVRLGELLVGLRLVGGHPVLRPLLVVGTIANLATSLVMMASIFEMRRAGVPALTIGSMSSFVAVGSLVGAVLSAAVVPRVRSGLVVTVGLVWVALWMAPLVASTTPTAVIVGLSGAVVAAPSLNAVLGSCLVALVPDGYQGRADSAVSLLASGTAPLAPLAAGFALQHAGFRVALIVGLGLILLALVPVAASRSVRALPRPDRWDRSDLAD